MKAIPPLLSIGDDHDLDVACLRKVGKFILRTVGAASTGMRARGTVPTGRNTVARGGGGGGAVGNGAVGQGLRMGNHEWIVEGELRVPEWGEQQSLTRSEVGDVSLWWYLARSFDGQIAWRSYIRSL